MGESGEMTDREMLELAAKAAGILLCGYSWIGENEDDEECEILEAAFVKHHQEQELASKWNPLADDGDALRLAARLNFRIDIQGGTVRIVDGLDNEHYLSGIATNQEDQMKGVRRAITRAAAQVGKEME